MWVCVVDSRVGLLTVAANGSCSSCSTFVSSEDVKLGGVGSATWRAWVPQFPTFPGFEPCREVALNDDDEALGRSVLDFFYLYILYSSCFWYSALGISSGTNRLSR